MSDANFEGCQRGFGLLEQGSDLAGLVFRQEVARGRGEDIADDVRRALQRVMRAR